jgi:hypothetical protein
VHRGPGRCLGGDDATACLLGPPLGQHRGAGTRPFQLQSADAARTAGVTRTLTAVDGANPPRPAGR